MDTIGLRIKNRRKELRLTQTKIYEKVGISSGHLSEIENGKVLPSSTSLISLSKVLNCSIDWILTGESSKYENPFPLKPRESDFLETFRKLFPSEQSEVERLMEFLLYKREEGKSSSSEITKSAHEIA